MWPAAAIILLGLGLVTTLVNLVWTVQWARAGHPPMRPRTAWAGALLALAGGAAAATAGWGWWWCLGALVPDAIWLFPRLTFPK